MSGMNEDTAGTPLHEWDCTKKCNSVQHGTAIYSIGTKGSDVQVINLWMKTCQNFSRVKDEFGRSAIHVASATGRTKLVVLLIKYFGVNPNSKDLLNGYTPLHMSIFFGHINVARAIVQNGGAQSLSSLDNEGLTPMGLIIKDRGLPDFTNAEYDVLIWGSNHNYSLGIGKENGRSKPELLESVPVLTAAGFVVLQTYHSIFVRGGGKAPVLMAGTGHRLGLNSLSAMTPQPVHFNHADRINCIQIGAGPDHTIFLLENGSVWACGLNQYCVLGLELDSSSEGIVKEPKRLQTLRKNFITHVTASQYHSVFCTDHHVFVCGMNCGQLGLPYLNIGEIIELPQLIPELWYVRQNQQITHCGCNEYATIIATNDLLIHIFHRNQRHTITIGYLPVKNILKLEVIGGNDHWAPLDSLPEKPKNPDNQLSMQLELFLLMNSEYVAAARHEPMVWRIKYTKGMDRTWIPQVYRISFGIKRSIVVRDMAVNQFGIIIVTDDGEAFQGKWEYLTVPMDSSKPKRIKSPRVTFVISGKTLSSTKNFSIMEITTMRIPGIDSGFKVACCPKNDSFAVIKWRRRRQDKSRNTLYSDIQKYSQGAFKSVGQCLLDLRKNATTEDNIHDCIFVVEDGHFEIPAHRFIISKVSKPLYDLITSASAATGDGDRKPVRVQIPEVNANVFRTVLDVLHSSPKFRWSCSPLNQSPELGKWFQTFVPYSMVENISFSHTDGLEFCDVVLVCSDHIKIPVHRCMLACRLLYFDVMFGSSGWSESVLASPEVKIPFRASAVSWLLIYIYDADSLLDEEQEGAMMKLDVDALKEIVQMSDMFMCEQLRVLAEARMIQILTQRNVTDMLIFSQQFNCSHLQRGCNEFLVDNLVYQLESRSLHDLGEDLVEGITAAYKEQILEPRFQDRFIRPYFDAPLDVVYDAASTPMDISQLELLISDADSVSPETNVNLSKRNKAKTKVRTKSVSLQDMGSPEAASISLSGSEYSKSAMLPAELDWDHDVDKGTPTNWTKVPKKADFRRSRKLSNNEEVLPGSHPNPVPNPYKLLLDPIQSQPHPLRKSFPIPIPPKEKAMELQNQRLKQVPNFNIVADFPLLDSESKESSLTPSPSSSTPIPKEGLSKGGKKKLKWVPVHPASSIEKNDVACPHDTESQNVVGTPPPQNPWKTIRMESPMADSVPTTIDFHKIVAQEEEKIENFRNATQKPLKLVQAEELMLANLTERYTTLEVLDGMEMLEVRRGGEHRLYSDPVWPCERPKSFGTPSPMKLLQSHTSTESEYPKVAGPSESKMTGNHVEFPELK